MDKLKYWFDQTFKNNILKKLSYLNIKQLILLFNSLFVYNLSYGVIFIILI